MGGEVEWDSGDSAASRWRTAARAGPVTVSGAHPNPSQIRAWKSGCSTSGAPPFAKRSRLPVSRYDSTANPCAVSRSCPVSSM